MLKHSRAISGFKKSIPVDFLLHWIPEESDCLSELVYLLKSPLSLPVWKFYIERFIQFHFFKTKSKLKTAVIPIPGSQKGKTAYHTKYFAKAWQQFMPCEILDCLGHEADSLQQKDLTLKQRGQTQFSLLEDFTTRLYQQERVVVIDDIVTSGNTLQSSLMALKPFLRRDCVIEIKALLSRDKI